MPMHFPMCDPAAFRRFRSNETSIINKFRLKKLTPRVPPLWKSLKVFGNDADRPSDYDSILTFHNTHRPLSHSFRDKRQFQSKIANFTNYI